MTSFSGCSAVASALALGARCRGFDSRHPDHFFAPFSKKHDAARLHFMHRRCASYGKAVLHKIRLTMKHCCVSLHNMKHFRLRSNMKHSAYASYDLSSIALRATDDEEMKNESFCSQQIPCSVVLTAERKNLLMRKSP